MKNSEERLEMYNEIAELKEQLHQHGKAIARIENWEKVAGPNSGWTLKRVLDIFKEEANR